MKKILLPLLSLLLLSACGVTPAPEPEIGTQPPTFPTGRIITEEDIPFFLIAPEPVTPDPWGDMPLYEPPGEDRAGLYYDERIPEALREQILASRYSWLQPASQEAIHRFATYTETGYDPEEDLRIAGIIEKTAADLTNVFSYGTPLTAEELEEDITFLFDYLKYAYGGYGYYGGDEFFLPLRDEMLAHLTQQDGVTVKELEHYLTKTLQSVINDFYFVVGSRMFFHDQASQHFYRHDELLFDLEDGEYVTQLEDEALRLVSVNGQSPQGRLRPTIAETGQLRWMVCLSTARLYGELALPLVLERADGTMFSREIEMKRSSPTGMNIPVSLTEMDGIPLLTIRRLIFADDEWEQKEEFLQTAETLRDEPIVILDIRSSSVGDRDILIQWLSKYLGRVWGGEFGALASQRITRAVAQSFTDGGFPEYAQTFWDVLEKTPELTGWTKPAHSSPKRIENSNLVLVIVDAYTGWTVGTAVDALRQMDNVIIIGSNTTMGGSFVSGAPIMLPVSRISIRSGGNLTLPVDLSLRDGYGYSPDLWVHPTAATQRAAALVRFYGLDQP